MMWKSGGGPVEAGLERDQALGGLKGEIVSSWEGKEHHPRSWHPKAAERPLETALAGEEGFFDVTWGLTLPGHGLPHRMSHQITIVE